MNQGMTRVAEPLDQWAKGSAEIPTPTDYPKPQLWRLLLRPRPPETETKGGILLPDVSKEAAEVATCVHEVIAVGETAFCERSTGEPWPNVRPLQPGEFVVTSRYAGSRITHKGVRYIIVNDDEILAKVDDMEAVRGFYA